MELQNIIDELGEDWVNYKQSLKEGLHNNNPFLQMINNYIFDGSGKQLRPILSILAARACGTPNKISWNCAAVSEMIHTATLLHDDVVDNSDFRRGMATVKSHFTPAVSVLTGDFWLSRALYLITNSGSEILHCYTKALEELADGELFQMQKAGELDISEDDYYTIIYKKTASLFVATLKSAVISVGGNSAELELIERYGYELGVAFQIRDDIFDYSPQLKTGKPFGGDIREKKITLPLIGAFTNAGPDKRVDVISRLRDTDCSNESETSSLVSYVLDFVERYNGMDYAINRLKDHASKAMEHIISLEREISGLSDLTDTQKRALNGLKSLAEFVANRVV